LQQFTRTVYFNTILQAAKHLLTASTHHQQFQCSNNHNSS